LVESLLFTAKATNRIGRVAEGNTVSDNADPNNVGRIKATHGSTGEQRPSLEAPVLGHHAECSHLRPRSDLDLTVKVERMALVLDRLRGSGGITLRERDAGDRENDEQRSNRAQNLDRTVHGVSFQIDGRRGAVG
jgi:hypothetical protein